MTDAEYINELEGRCENAVHKIERLQDALHEIRSWCRAYPRDVFIEPSREMWAKAAQVLKETEGCPSLDAISGSNMRHVVEGIQKIIDQALPTGSRDGS